MTCRLAFSAVVLLAAGCGPGLAGDANRAATGFGPRNAAAAPIDESPDPAEDAAYRHDFGVVRPGQKLRHSFAIRNTSSKAWTIQRFHSDCACTVGKASAGVILPSRSESVEITYQAPSNYVEDRRRVGVQFAEAEAPMLWLEVSARVRDAVSVLPGHLELRVARRGDVPEAVFEVHNYNDRDIELGPVRSSVPWLSEASRVALRGDAVSGPRQVWRIQVRAAVGGLRGGRYRGELAMAAEGATGQPKPVTVDLVVPAPVEAIPSQMFLGSVMRGAAARGTVLLKWSRDLEASTADALSLSHDLGEWLQLDHRPLPSNHWEVSATLTPGADAPAMIEGTIVVTFRGGEVPPIRIPLLAKVRAP